MKFMQFEVKLPVDPDFKDLLKNNTYPALNVVIMNSNPGKRRSMYVYFRPSYR